jgi:zinc protease
MKRLCYLIVILALATSATLAQTTAAPKLSNKTPAEKPWQKIPTPPLRRFQPHEPVRIQLSNGMIIFLQEDHELPTIDGVARIRGGARAVPKEKTGLISIYAQVWRTGGTLTHTGDELDDMLEARAAKVETGGGADSTNISFSCLKPDFEDVFATFLDVLHNPAFREDKIELAKAQLYTGIARRNDDIDEIASRESVRLAYGPNNPYAYIPEYATVGADTRDDLVAWHKQHVAPNNIILGIVGDFDPAVMEARLRKAFGNWPRGPQVEAEKIDFTPPKPGLFFIPKEDVNQSQIEMVGIGTREDNPDFYALDVLNEVLSGGFSSRLIMDLRTKAGLAYDVGGGVGFAFDHPGITRFSMGTKSATTVDGIQGLWREIEELKTRPVTDAEMKQAKDSLLNSWVFLIDTRAKVLSERMRYEFYGYPPDFVERYRTGIEKVTLADVNRVAREYIHKDKLAVLVVGNPTEFGKPLKSLGPVQQIDITIPGVPPQAARKPPGE